MGKKRTSKRKTNILIVGAGERGKLLIDLFHKNDTLKILGVVDIDQNAPGMKLARKNLIPTASDYKKFLDKDELDEIINLTGSKKVQKELVKLKPSHVQVIGGYCAQLTIDLIKDHKQLEGLLRIKNNSIESSINAIAFADLQGNLTYVNNSFLKLWAYKDDKEVLGKHILQFWYSKEKASEVIESLHAKGNWVGELLAKKKDGSIFDVQLSASMVKDDSGTPLCMMSTFIDITEHKRAESLLRESEEKYRDLYDNAPDMYHTLDNRGIIIDCNETEARMLGYNKHELIGRPITHFFTKESQQLFKNDFPRLNREKRLLNLERIYVRKDGSTFPAMLNVFSEYDEHGNFVKAKTISRDITILKLAERALIDSEKKYRDLVDNALIGIFQTSIDGRILYVNEALSTMLEFESPEATMTESVITRYKYPRDREVLIANLLKEHKVNSFEFELLTKTGKTKHVLLSATLNNDVISGMIMDITEHKRAEERITFLAQVLNTSPLSVIATDEHEKIIYVNPATEKLFGYKDHELLGKDPTILNADPDAGNIHKNILDTVCQNKVWSGEILNRKKNGDLFYIQDTIYKLTDEKGDFIAFVGFAEDINDRKKLEQQLLQAQKMEAVGQLAGGIAHDFNNILTAIIGYGNLLKTEMRTDDPLTMYIQRILTSAQRAANLTRGLLTFSRTQIMQPRPLNLNDIIKGIDELLSRLIGESIELSILLTHEDLTIMADSSQIELVLLNLSTNAMDAMPDGGDLTIRTERVTSGNNLMKSQGLEKSSYYALLSITDTGQGIDEMTKERIFDPFFTTKEVGRGTGLGLSMAYGIIKQHNGHIDVYSEPGKGTTFKVYFPLIQTQVAEDKVTKPLITKTGKETILIAEDDIHVRELVKQLLEIFGYNVIEARDGDAALDAFIKNKDEIHLLLLDVIMPKKNGKEVYDEIKKLRPDIKAIFISGYSADIIHNKGILEEGLEFLSKPIFQETLLNKVREVLDR